MITKLYNLILKKCLIIAFILMSIQAFGVEKISNGVIYEIDLTAGNAAIIGHDASKIKENVTIPESITYDGEKYSVLSIASNSFKGLTSLKHISLPNSITTIGSSAFENCSGLQSFSLSNSITHIEKRTFAGCSSLTSISSMPTSITFIGDSAFFYCKNLISVILPPSLTKTGKDLFRNCKNLVKSAYPATISNPFVSTIFFTTNTGSLSFRNEYYGSAHSYPVNAVVEDFIIYSSDKTSILFGSVMLNGEVCIPESVTAIINSAFSKCSNITTLKIDNSALHIKDRSFTNCSGLKNIHLTCDTPPTIEEKAFENLYSNINLYVPENSIIAYLRSPWNIFENINGGKVSQLSDDFLKYRTYTSEHNKLAILIRDYSYATLTSAYIPRRIANEFGDFLNVVAIDDYALSNCSKLTEVTFQNNSNVSSIGKFAFQSTPISTISLPESVYKIEEGAFCQSGLTEFRLPAQVTAIPEKMFSGSTAIKRIILHSEVTEIGDNAFSDCLALENVENCNSVKHIGNSIFKNCKILKSIKLSNELESIGNQAFATCESLPGIELPNTLKSIGYSALYGCKSITSVKLPDSVKYLGKYAFKYCSGLNSVELSKSLTSIEEGTFERCGTLETLELPKTLKEIEAYAFYLTEFPNGLTIPASVNYIGNYALSSVRNLRLEDCDSIITINQYGINYSAISSIYMGRRISSNYSHKWVNLESLTVGSTISEIEDFEFEGCSKLSEINFGCGVKSIGNNAFAECALTKVVIPPSVEKIGANAFSDNNLTDVSIGYGIKEIGDKAFYQQNGINRIYVTAPVPPTAANSVFRNYNLPLYLMPEAVRSYEDSPYCWSRFNTSDMIAATDLSIEFEGNSENKNRLRLKASIEPENVSLDNIFWKSSNTDLAIVDNYGYLTLPANNSGRVEVTALSMYDNIRHSIFFNADENNSSIVALGDTAVILSIDGRYRLDVVTFASDNSGNAITWNSSDKSIATVYDGIISGIAPGKCTVTASYNGKQMACDVYVVDLGLSSTDVVLDLGQTRQLKALAIPDELIKEPITWQSSDEKIATVSESGLIEAVGYGECVIEARMGSATVSCNVTITTEIKGIHLNARKIVVYGYLDTFSYKLYPIASPSNTELASVIWSSSNPKFVDVKNGVPYISSTKGEEDVTGTITAKVSSGISDFSSSCEMVLKPYKQPSTEEYLSCELLSAEIAEGAEFKFSITHWPYFSEPIMFHLDESIAKIIVKDGGYHYINAISPGHTTVTAYTNNGLQYSFDVIVYSYDGTSGIEEIIPNDISDDLQRPNDIYNLQGVCLKRDASQEDIDALAPGLYIIGGKKIIVN